MRLSCIICTINLIILGICGGVSAFVRVNVLQILCFNNVTAMRSFLAVGMVSALFEVYALIAFKPFRGLK